MQRSSVTKKLLAAVAGTVFALLIGEGCLRLFVGPFRALGILYFRTSDGERIPIEGANEEAKRRGLAEDLPADQTPPNRPRSRFAPNAHFYMCYEDVGRLDADWLDDRGCVEVRINAFGLRERDDIRPDNKQPDEKRVLCVGDSFTFGWGIPVEQCWVRRLEEDLRVTNGNVRTVNCGASGALTVDEYEVGLRTRFGQFRPDVLIVSIYCNDLIPSHGLCVLGAQRPQSGILLFDYLAAATLPGPLDLDPSADWVAAALGLPRETGEAIGVYGADKPFDGMWSQGAPQRALAAMSAWSKEHNCKLLVMLWPFLQGVGPGESYPFTKLHGLVAEGCRELGLPFLDLLPVLQQGGEKSRRLWVTPTDMHANPRAQAIVRTAIAEFARANWPR